MLAARSAPHCVAKADGSRVVMNLALFTYFIPAAFLAVPMYRTMGKYGLLNNDWSLILAMVTIASPYAIWVLKQASDKLPVELDEAAVVDEIAGEDDRIGVDAGSLDARERALEVVGTGDDVPDA